MKVNAKLYIKGSNIVIFQTIFQTNIDNDFNMLYGLRKIKIKHNKYKCQIYQALFKQF